MASILPLPIRDLQSNAEGPFGFLSLLTAEHVICYQKRSGSMLL